MLALSVSVTWSASTKAAMVVTRLAPAAPAPLTEMGFPASLAVKVACVDANAAVPVVMAPSVPTNPSGLSGSLSQTELAALRHGIQLAQRAGGT